MLKHGGLSVSEEAGAKPTGKISTLSATVYVAHLVEGAFGEKPDPEVGFPRRFQVSFLKETPMLRYATQSRYREISTQLLPTRLGLGLTC